MTALQQVQTTLPTRDQAERLARRLVEARLAACVQVLGPIASTYRWEGAIESAQEWLCVIKAPRAAFEPLAAAIRAEHPYETPEILAVDVVDGDGDYLAWAEAETRLDRRPGA